MGARTGDLLMETGALGSREVKENSLSSTTRIRMASGPGDSCVAQPNNFSAPVMEAARVFSARIRIVSGVAKRRN